MITEMADRQVNGRNAALISLKLHIYPYSMPGMIGGSRLELVSLVKVGHTEAILATYFP